MALNQQIPCMDLQWIAQKLLEICHGEVLVLLRLLNPLRSKNIVTYFPVWYTSMESKITYTQNSVEGATWFPVS